jgi:hypothetical protein
MTDPDVLQMDAWKLDYPSGATNRIRHPPRTSP